MYIFLASENVLFIWTTSSFQHFKKSQGEKVLQNFMQDPFPPIGILPKYKAS